MFNYILLYFIIFYYKIVNILKPSSIPKSVMKEQSNIIKNKKKRKTKPNDETEQLQKTQKIEETDDLIIDE